MHFPSHHDILDTIVSNKVHMTKWSPGENLWGNQNWKIDTVPSGPVSESLGNLRNELPASIQGEELIDPDSDILRKFWINEQQFNLLKRLELVLFYQEKYKAIIVQSKPYSVQIPGDGWKNMTHTSTDVKFYSWVEKNIKSASYISINMPKDWNPSLSIESVNKDIEWWWDLTKKSWFMITTYSPRWEEYKYFITGPAKRMVP